MQNTTMYAFWAIDAFPFIAGEEVVGFNDEGDIAFLKSGKSGEYAFVLVKKQGESLLLEIKDISQQYYLELAATRLKYSNKLNKALKDRNLQKPEMPEETAASVVSDVLAIPERTASNDKPIIARIQE